MKVIGVVGSGQMGAGIAQVAAQSGYRVIVEDIISAALEKASIAIDKSLGKLFEKKAIEEDPKTIASRIRAGLEKNKTWFLSLRSEPENTDFFTFLNITIL